MPFCATFAGGVTFVASADFASSAAATGGAFTAVPVLIAAPVVVAAAVMIAVVAVMVVVGELVAPAVHAGFGARLLREAEEAVVEFIAMMVPARDNITRIDIVARIGYTARVRP